MERGFASRSMPLWPESWEFASTRYQHVLRLAEPRSIVSVISFVTQT
jgi:hypothetical protein